MRSDRLSGADPGPYDLLGAGLYRRRRMSRTLIVIGLVILAVGLLWPLLSKLGLGRLPGDIVIERGNFTLYLPIATCLLISVVLSIILWLLNR
jgi:hypothetical protein